MPRLTTRKKPPTSIATPAGRPRRSTARIRPAVAPACWISRRRTAGGSALRMPFLAGRQRLGPQPGSRGGGAELAAVQAELADEAVDDRAGIGEAVALQRQEN